MEAKKPYIINGERATLEEYRKTKYEDLRIRVPVGHKDEIQAHAAALGESLNGYVIKAVDERITRENGAIDDTVKGDI